MYTCHFMCTISIKCSLFRVFLIIAEYGNRLLIGILQVAWRKKNRMNPLTQIVSMTQQIPETLKLHTTILDT